MVAKIVFCLVVCLAVVQCDYLAKYTNCPKGPCQMSCILKEENIFSADYSINVDKYNAWVDSLPQDDPQFPEAMRNAGKQMIPQCKDKGKGAANECDAGKLIWDCLKPLLPPMP